MCRSRILRDVNGWTEYHEKAKYGSFHTNDLSILKMQDNHGWSVAHIMARSGHRCFSDEVLNLTTKSGVKVKDIVDGYGRCLKVS